MEKKKRIWTVLILAWMVVIFLFSAKPSDESSADSLFVGRLVGKIFLQDFDEWTKEEQEAFVESINYPVRKTAHATEYAILGSLILARFMYQESWSGKRKVLTAWGISTLYAATDEFHQLFVPGRACMVTDVMIDSAGALVGIMLVAVFTAFIIGRNSRSDRCN